MCRVGRGAAVGGGDAGAPRAGPARDLGEMPQVVGLALLHPTTGQDGEGGLSFTRLLGASRYASVLGACFFESCPVNQTYGPPHCLPHPSPLPAASW